MASITITTTADQDARIVAAFQQILFPTPNPDGTVRQVTAADVKGWLIAQLRTAVMNYERNQQAKAIQVDSLDPS